MAFSSSSKRGTKSSPSLSSDDEVPLNKSFDTAETSDTYCSVERKSYTSNGMTTTVWGMTGITGVMATTTMTTASSSNIPKQRRPSFSSTETLKVRNSARHIVQQLRTDFRPKQYSARSLDIMPELSDGFHDEPEPRAVVLPRPPMIQNELGVVVESTSEFFDKLVAIPPGANLRCQEECDTREGQEEDARFAEEVWVDNAKFVAHEMKSSSETSIQEAQTRAVVALGKDEEKHDTIACHEIVWTAWGCDDLKTRRHVTCFLTLLFLFIFVFSFLIGLLVSEKSEPVLSSADIPLATAGEDTYQWIGDLPENKPSEKPPHLKPRPTNVPLPVPHDSYSNSPSSHPLSRNLNIEGFQRMPTPSTWLEPSKSNMMTNDHGSASSSSIQRPITCPSLITVDKKCYVEEEDVILITFVNCNPKINAWVGIWRSDIDVTNLSESIFASAWFCGTTCQNNPFSNFLAFEAHRLGVGGFYRAFLVHETPNGTPYVVEAKSEPFLVTNECSR